MLVLVLALPLSLWACQDTAPRQVDAASVPTGPVITGPDLASEAPAQQSYGRPISVEIPAIAVAAQVVQVALRTDGSMDVPDFGLAGWYGLGPRPGEPGPAVVVAHVDSQGGPDVFFRLKELQVGDTIIIRTDAATTHTFVVEHLEQAPKDQLPVDRIWGDTEDSVLRLITCGGSFDRSTGHYRDNVIVYARAG